jgi:hypothetical protein
MLSPSHLSPLTLMQPHPLGHTGHTLCVQTECTPHGVSLMSDFLTAPCYRLTTSCTFTLVDLGTRATQPHPSPSRTYGPRVLTGSTFIQNQSSLWTWTHEPSSHDLHPHPLRRMGHTHTHTHTHTLGNNERQSNPMVVASDKGWSARVKAQGNQHKSNARLCRHEEEDETQKRTLRIARLY